MTVEENGRIVNTELHKEATKAYMSYASYFLLPLCRTLQQPWLVASSRLTISLNTPYCDTYRYGSGSETPMHPSRTPLHPYITPMRDSGATLIHDGMRTPMRDRAWNPYTPISPPRDSWEDENPGS
nr:putative transcription elongation factor SPT5 homolog 1 [Tanacetum cinerariifolium]